MASDHPPTIKFAKTCASAVAPSQAESGSLLDLFACEEVCVGPGETAAVNTGIRVEIPENYFIMVLGRSGLSLNESLTVVTGIIEPTYRHHAGLCQ